MADLNNLAPLQNMDLTMGGIVTGLREGQSKKGNPYAFAKVEDYSGSYEFAFFGKDWIERKTYFNIGMFLYMKGKCQPKQWRQDEFEVKVNTIELLPEIKDKVIEKLTITAPLSAIDEEIIEEFSALVQENPGNAELTFYVQDEEGQHVTLTSKKWRVSVQKNIVAYLDDKPFLSYKIN